MAYIPGVGAKFWAVLLLVVVMVLGFAFFAYVVRMVVYEMRGRGEYASLRIVLRNRNSRAPGARVDVIRVRAKVTPSP